MQTLSQDIKGRTFKPVYLLFGEGAFLKKSYENRLREAFTGENTMNYNYFEGKGMNVNEVIGLADTMPSFAEKHFVLMEDNGFFKDGAGVDELTEYMGGIPESTCLIFVKLEMDERSRLYKAVEKYDYATKLNHQGSVQLVRWAAGTLSRNGKKITGRIVKFFLSKAGDGMENINSEPERLIGYILGRKVITDKDVEIIYTTQVTNGIFDMITVITARQTRKAMDLYEDLLTLKEPPTRILFLIARQFDQILQIKDLMGKGVDKSTITSRLELQPFVAGKIILQARAFAREQIPPYVDLCVDAEESIKTEKLQDRLTVELLIASRYE